MQTGMLVVAYSENNNLKRITISGPNQLITDAFTESGGRYVTDYVTIIPLITVSTFVCITFRLDRFSTGLSRAAERGHRAVRK